MITMKSVTRRYTKKQLKRMKFRKELRKLVLTLLLILAIVLAVQAVPIALGLSPYYQCQYEMAPLPDKIEILKRGLAVKHGRTFITFNSYEAEMNGDAIIRETYDNEQDKEEGNRLLAEWGIIGG